MPPPDYWIVASQDDMDFDTAKLSAFGGNHLGGVVEVFINEHKIKSWSEGSFATRIPTKQGTNQLTLSGHSTNTMFLRIIHTRDPEKGKKVVLRDKITLSSKDKDYVREFVVK